MSRGYDRLAWVDYPAELTPISAENLNRIEDGIETLYNDRDHMESNLAIVDDNERASRDYAINTYVMRNGVFYKVILDIQENEEFNDETGGNIRPVSVSSQLGSGGGGSTGCVELTQAEYDALPEEDKMADVIYLITDTPNNFLDEVFGDFASVEYTNKASKAYAVGEYLMLDSKLYRVTAAISQNDTITAGTNVIATTVGSEFNAVGDRLHNVLGNYAEVEPEAVASKIYAAGDFLILNDYLYKTTSAIATGEDLIEGTNIEKTTVGGELNICKASSLKVVMLNTGDKQYINILFSESVAFFRIDCMNRRTSGKPFSALVQKYNENTNYVVNSNDTTDAGNFTCSNISGGIHVKMPFTYAYAMITGVVSFTASAVD